MDLNSFLYILSNISQSIVKFLFASKWSIWIIILIVVIYFIWKGLENEEKKRFDPHTEELEGDEEE